MLDSHVLKRKDHSGPPGKNFQTLVAGWAVTSVRLEGHYLRYPEVGFMDSGKLWEHQLWEKHFLFSLGRIPAKVI
jgi:hypothetical protein